MTTTALTCQGARTHSPRYFEVDVHHVFPTYLCALLAVAKRSETVILCATCHDNAHHVLRHLINTGSWNRHRLAPGLREIVARAWAWWQATVMP